MSAEPGRRLGHSAPKEDPKPRVACTPLVAHNLGAMASVVELRGARKRFGQVEAVKGVDLAIGAGELVADFVAPIVAEGGHVPHRHVVKAGRGGIGTEQRGRELEPKDPSAAEPCQHELSDASRDQTDGDQDQSEAEAEHQHAEQAGHWLSVRNRGEQQRQRARVGQQAAGHSEAEQDRPARTGVGQNIETVGVSRSPSVAMFVLVLMIVLVVMQLVVRMTVRHRREHAPVAADHPEPDPYDE